ncbi:MAG TPA: metalloregulator ArsR/SmtB family transcription factor [Candidatus Acidoferrales bacterium]
MTSSKVKGPDLQREVCSRHAEMCKVFTHPIRLQILDILREQETSVSHLADRLGVAIGNLSQHLNMMKQRRVLVSRKDGNNVYYRLANPKMLKAFDLMREILLEQMQRESVLVRHMQRAQVRS